jgi:hypothetical protein
MALVGLVASGNFLSRNGKEQTLGRSLGCSHTLVK